MRYCDYRTLVNRGRKAGLGTADLYSAMVTRAAEAREIANGQTDPNGYVVAIDEFGHRIFRPAGDQPRT